MHVPFLLLFSVIVTFTRAQLCPFNINNDYYILTDVTAYAGAEEACAANGLLFAPIPDLVTLALVSNLLVICGGTSLYTEGYLNLNVPLGECPVLTPLLGGLVTFLTGVQCETPRYVLCADVALLGDDLITVTTSTRTILTTTVRTTTVSTLTSTLITTGTSLVTTTSTSITVTTDPLLTIYTTTLPTPTTRISTITWTSTVTETNPSSTSATIATTINVGTVTGTYTDSISLTEQVYISLPLTLIKHETSLSFTCFNTDAATTTTVTETVTTGSACPTKKLMACPCTVYPDGLVLVANTDIPRSQADCACDRINAEPADLTTFDVQYAKNALNRCTGQCISDRTAWIRSWQGDDTQCWAIDSAGAVTSVNCSDQMSVLCRVPQESISCFGCQFRWSNNCCRCPPFLQIHNPFAVCYSGPDSCNNADSCLCNQKAVDLIEQTTSSTSTVTKTTTITISTTLSTTRVSTTTTTTLVTSAISTTVLTFVSTAFSSTVSAVSTPQTTSVTVTEMLDVTDTEYAIATSTSFSVDIVVVTTDEFTTIASTTDFLFSSTTTTTDLLTVQLCL